MSRQYEWQLKQLAKGRCVICGKSTVTKYHCKRHSVAQNKYVRKWKERRKNEI